MALSRVTLSEISRSAVVGLTYGRFTADGVTDPSVLGGKVRSVRRLVDAGAKPFFRVKYTHNLKVADPNFNIQGTATLTGAVPHAVVDADGIVAAPADVRALDEIDVQIISIVDGSPADTAGVVVYLQLAYPA